MENEQLLAAYARTRSAATLDEVVRRNQNLLHHILKRFSYASEPYEDMLQVANLGLIKAAQRFDGDRGVRFSTYATAVVDGELRHHLRDSLLMRQPRWVKKVYQQIQDKSNELMHKLGRPPEVAELAQALNINEDGILEVMNLYSRIQLHSQDEPFISSELQSGADPSLAALAPADLVRPADRGPHHAVRRASTGCPPSRSGSSTCSSSRTSRRAKSRRRWASRRRRYRASPSRALGRLREVLGKKVF